ncbi:MAG: ISAs1 family transposase, partial [Azonexus sp.]|nr:ISAs1 family transposase [Azonexus sp.]
LHSYSERQGNRIKIRMPLSLTFGKNRSLSTGCEGGLFTHANIAQAIRDKEADYVLAVKDNQPKLAESITTFFEIGQAEHWKNTPHTYVESVEKDHGRLEVRRCWALTQLDCLAEPQQWADLKMSA